MNKLPFFHSMKEAQEYLDNFYSLPIWKLVKHYKHIRVVVDNTK